MFTKLQFSEASNTSRLSKICFGDQLTIFVASDDTNNRPSTTIVNNLMTKIMQTINYVLVEC